MAVNIFVLTASGKLGKYKNRILENADESAKNIGKKIPLPDVDVVFYDNPSLVIPHIGIGGYTQNANLVFMPLNPEFKYFEKTISEEINRALAHELYHCVQIQNNGYVFAKTLLEAMTNEGLADHFELEITNKKPQKWDSALTAKQFSIMKKKAAKEFNNKNYNHAEWFFGSKTRKIPKWAGYAIGFRIVGEYLEKHPDKKPSQLFAAKVEEFVK